MNPIRVEVLRDEAGVPTVITVSKSGRQCTVQYDKTGSFTVVGSLPEKFADVLQMQAAYGRTAVDVVAQTIGSIDIDIAAQSVGNLDVNLAAQAANININFAAQAADVDVNITNASIAITGTVNATVTGTVNIGTMPNVTIGSMPNVTIAGTVTITGAVTITSGAVTVSTAGGVNIVLDKLTQNAYTANQLSMTNDGASPAGQRASTTGGTVYGKFFPRGCRGHKKDVYLECKDAGAAGGTITVYLAPQPGMGAVASATITVAAGGALTDRTASFNRFWNYDSLFIWWISSTADMQVSYDTAVTYDGFTSADAGVTWDRENARNYVTVLSYGRTVGDVPVSGTINNIPIPNTMSNTDLSVANVVSGTETELTTIHGAGELVQIRVQFGTATAPAVGPPLIAYAVAVYVDGSAVYSYWYNEHLTMSQTATSGSLSFGEFYQTATLTYLVIRLPIQFRRSLKITCTQSTGVNVNVAGQVITNLIS